MMEIDYFESVVSGLDDYWMTFDQHKRAVMRARAELNALRAVKDAARGVRARCIAQDSHSDAGYFPVQWLAVLAEKLDAYDALDTEEQ